MILRGLAAIFLLILGGCYISSPLRCGPDNRCPAGLTCSIELQICLGPNQDADSGAVDRTAGPDQQEFDTSAVGVCGDGVPTGTEVCDDGNTDDCQGTCLGDCSRQVVIFGCNDGIRCGDEQCDHGSDNGTGEGYCLSDCSAVQQCGDGISNGTEYCDDGFQDSCGTCNADCTAAGTGSLCGDGEHCPQTENCDDGFQDACGSCNSDCTAAGTGSLCGDGEHCQQTEFCDDGFQDPCGSCNSDCTATGTGSLCGDGEHCQQTEFCDDGFEDDCGTCNADCSAPGAGSRCGDGERCPQTEFCDDGYQDSCGTCNADCSSLGSGSLCGDGEHCQETEFCDDGYLDPCGSCNADCTAEGSGSICGDGEHCPQTEFCDDGYLDPCGSCNADCTAEGSGSTCGDGERCPQTEFCDDGYLDSCGSCNADCTAPGTAASCGDGLWCPEIEGCDDGNTSDCSGSCLGDCSATVNLSGCSDGVICPPENCDDGNTANSDGCSALCQVESHWSCSGQPSLCQAETSHIAVGHNHSCALSTNGELKCWGAAEYGRLGLGDEDNRGDQSGEMGQALPPIALGVSPETQHFSLGEHHSCGIVGTGAVKCWGRNHRGQLGLGDNLNRGDNAGEMESALQTIALGDNRSATTLALGGQHSCALLDNGQLKCWGEAGFGQLGLGTTNPRGDDEGEMGNALPRVELGDGLLVEQVEAGFQHTCVLLDSAQIKCWGSNFFGQLGLGDTNNRGDNSNEMGGNLAPVNLGSIPASAVSAGGQHSCALLLSGEVKCWGHNAWGQLGLGQRSGSWSSVGDQPDEMGELLPSVDLGNGRTALAVTAGGNHSCAILDDSTVKCWGSNIGGRLGLGDLENRGDDDNEMGDLLPVVGFNTAANAEAIVAGDGHTCVLFDDGAVRCWGYNAMGQLGLGDTDPRGDDSFEILELEPIRLGEP